MKRYLIYALTVFALACGFASCQSDNFQDPPVITAVRVADPELADSTFVKAWPGSQIVILGQNLSNAHHLYINDYSLYFNPTTNTDHSIIVNIPTEEDGFVMSQWNEDVKKEIRVETPGGVAVYDFLIMCPSPYGQRVAGLYPREAGDKLKFYGMELLDIKRVFITDVSVEEIAELETMEELGGNQVSITEFTPVHNHYLDSKKKTYVTESVLDFVMPDLPYDSGTMVVECEAGYAYCAFAKRPPRPTITYLSSDMPENGEIVTLRGTSFIQVELVKYGDVVIPAEDLTVAESEDEITFVFPQEPAEESSTLTVITPGGEASMDFYHKECLLLDFDTMGIDNNWGPNAQFLAADGLTPPYTSNGTFGLIDCSKTWSWWDVMIFWRAGDNGAVFELPSYDLIPAETPAEKVYLAMENYNMGEAMKNDGAFIVYLLKTKSGDSEWSNWQNNALSEPVLQTIDGEQPVGCWYRSVVPMSHFGLYAGKTYRDIVESGLKEIRLMYHNHTGNSYHMQMCFDNVRIITE